MEFDQKRIKQLAKHIRRNIISSTTKAGSGHTTSSLSAVELMTVLFFGGFFKFNKENPRYHNNDRIIFSKGHAAPLYYALWAAAEAIPEEELNTLRIFGSRLEGHPVMAFPFTEAPTGSLGQGLSIGVGMALNAKYLDKLSYHTYVLLGDSEMTEGSVWEAMEIASYYKLNNLIAIIDVNRLGQRGETMYGHNLSIYDERCRAFGWNTLLVADGHDLKQIADAYAKALKSREKPTVIIAKTVKGRGVSFLEDKDGFHGKALTLQESQKALAEIGVSGERYGQLVKPESVYPPKLIQPAGLSLPREYHSPVATREAYGYALLELYTKNPRLVVLDAEVSNSTMAEIFKKHYPERFFEMFIAEQNMVGVALGLARRGKLPFVSSFAAFLTRAHDQIRMCQYAQANVNFVGSHAGVSIGADGSSQMGLEDIAMFRSLLNSVVLYPADAFATHKSVELAASHPGISYIRITRASTPLIYNSGTQFTLGGSHILRQSKNDVATIVAAGITLYEALQAQEELAREGINVRVIDLYSIKPIDGLTLIKAARETGNIIVVEDHFAQGGIGEAVASEVSCVQVPVYIMAVQKIPKSGTPSELLNYEEISKKAIINKVKEIYLPGQSSD